MGEIVVRLETPHGFQSYAIDEQQLALRTAESYKTLMDVLPDVIRVPIGGLLFGLRHGPIQKLLRDRGLEPMCKDCKDKDMQAILALVRIFSGSVREAQAAANTTTLDMMQADLYKNAEGFIRRVPEYDALPSIFPPSQSAREPIDAIAEPAEPQPAEA